MNEKGAIPILVFILIGLAVLALLPVILSAAFWQVKLVMQLILIFVIYTTVRSYIGDSPLTIVFSAILIYLMVFKWFYIVSSAWVFTFLMGFGFMSVIVWGIGTQLRPH
jgi:hypothetical protein